MTKEDAMRAIITDYTPEIGQIYILEDIDPVRVITCVKNRLLRCVYDTCVKASTGSIYLFRVTDVDQYEYKDEDYNVIRIHTASIDGELRFMDDQTKNSKMTKNQKLYFLFGEAINAPDCDLYVSEWSTSSIFRDCPDAVRVPYLLRCLWDVANLPFRDLRAKIGLTQAELASRLCTSKRTVENWDSGQRSCSPTIRILFAESFGLLDVHMLLILLDTGAED